MIVIFGFFIIMMEADSRIVMFYFLVGFLAILAFVAFFTPGFFKNKNLKGDGWVIIGEKYAYINGFFSQLGFSFFGNRKCRNHSQTVLWPAPGVLLLCEVNNKEYRRDSHSCTGKYEFE